jgi:hypothetical protein
MKCEKLRKIHKNGQFQYHEEFIINKKSSNDFEGLEEMKYDKLSMIRKIKC